MNISDISFTSAYKISFKDTKQASKIKNEIKNLGVEFVDGSHAKEIFITDPKRSIEVYKNLADSADYNKLSLNNAIEAYSRFSKKAKPTTKVDVYR